MEEAIYETINAFAKMNSCPAEIRLPKDDYIRLYGEVLRKTTVFIEGKKMDAISGFWIDFNGPLGKTRVMPC